MGVIGATMYLMRPGKTRARETAGLGKKAVSVTNSLSFNFGSKKAEKKKKNIINQDWELGS